MYELFTILPGALGLFMLLLGLWILSPLWGFRSVEVEAECVAVQTGTASLGKRPDKTYYPDSKLPVYRYTYQGETYQSSPLLTSNRRGYKPKEGPCTVRINPMHPERVYSSERKFAAAILLSIGAIWIVLAIFILSR